MDQGFGVTLHNIYTVNKFCFMLWTLAQTTIYNILTTVYVGTCTYLVCDGSLVANDFLLFVFDFLILIDK